MKSLHIQKGRRGFYDGDTTLSLQKFACNGMVSSFGFHNISFNVSAWVSI